MKLFPIAFGLTLFAGPVFSAAPSMPLHAVIGPSGSTIVEEVKAGLPLSMVPLSDTLMPLSDHFPLLSTPMESDFVHWQSQMNNKVKVVHHSRDLAFQGTLSGLTSDRFELDTGDATLRLPINDFYLIPLSGRPAPTEISMPFDGKLAYQTEQLFWQPKLSLLLQQDKVAILQQAKISNRSSHSLTLESPILGQETPRPAPQPVYMRKNLGQMEMASADFAEVAYENNQALVPIKGRVSLPPFSHSLVPIDRQEQRVESLEHHASVRTHPGWLGKQTLQFEYQLKFKLDHDVLPGNYQTYWVRDGYLIPANATQLESLRKGETLSITPGKSEDISSELSLIQASSQTLPTTQTWRWKVSNHSNKPQTLVLDHQMSALIKSFSGLNAETLSADTRRIQHTVPANSELELTYRVDLTR